MLPFLCLYIGVYGGLAAYVLARLRAATGPRLAPWPLLALAWAAIVLGPLVVHRIRDPRWYALARAGALAAYTLMAVVFWLALLYLAVDAWNAVSRLVAATGGARIPRVPARPAALLCAGLTGCACAWGWWEAGRLRVRRLTVPVAAWPPGAAPLRLVQVADLHLGRTSFASRNLAVARAVAALQADLIVSTGDLVDAADPALMEALAPWRELRPRLGKLAVVGNHEVYPGLETTSREIAAAGFDLLRHGERRLFEGRLLVIGVDDPAVARPPDARLAPEESVLPPATGGGGPTVLLLKHQPRVTPAARARADLQLSGHTHAGQIFPFGLFVALVYPYAHGRLVADGPRLRLHVSVGSGTWGPPLRLLAPPEVTVLELVPPAAPATLTPARQAPAPVARDDVG